MLQGQLLIANPQPYAPYMLCLQDPANPTNDLGCKSFAIKHVQATMKTLAAVLRQDLARTTPPGPMGSLLRSLVGRCDLLYDQRRAKLELFGEGFLRERT